MKQVIFDTDIGIDDAMALLFLHYAPAVELRAIVTGFGNASVENTTRNALYVKEQFGISAPVFSGESDALAGRLSHGYPDFVHGKNGLGDIEFDNPSMRAESTPGPQAIVDLVTECPGEISIIAVGRMTNLARAIEICPELPQLVREVVIMGGAFGFNGHRGNVSPVAEANIAGDPLAADIVFGSGLQLTIVGLDVSQEVILTNAYFNDLKKNAGKAGELIYDISRCYLAHHQRISGSTDCPIHDSSAVAYLLQPDLFTTQAVTVRVVTEGMAMGQTIHATPGAHYETDAWDNRPPCNICTAVDAAGLRDLYRETLSLAVQ